MYFHVSLLFLYLPSLVSSYNSSQNLSIFPRLLAAAAFGPDAVDQGGSV